MEDNPYASPESVREETKSARSNKPGSWAAPFETSRTRGMVAIGIVVLSMVVSVTSVATLLAQVSLLERAKDGEAISTEEANRNDSLVTAFQVAQLGCVALGAICIPMWMHRAYRNLPALGIAHPEFTPGWVVGNWFIPIINLFRPFQAMKEIWLGSDPRSLGDRRWRERSGAGRVIAWWACWLGAGFITRFSSTMFSTEINPNNMAPGLNQLITASYALVTANGFHLVAGGLIISIILEVCRRQDERYELIESGALDRDEPSPI